MIIPKLSSVIRGKTPLGKAVRCFGLAFVASGMIASCGGAKSNVSPAASPSPTSSPTPVNSFEWVKGKQEQLYPGEPYRYVFDIDGKVEVVAFGANFPGYRTFCFSRQQSGDNRGLIIAADGTPSITSRGLTAAECNKINSQSFVAPSIGEPGKSWQTKHVV